jgi:lysophospholipase L1-like esterase
MKRDVMRGVITSCTILIGLLALAFASPLLPAHGPAGILRAGIAQARGRNSIWWNSLWKSNNGYYEQLMTGSGDPRILNSPVTRFLEGQDPWGKPLPQIYEDSGGFLLSETKPNLDFVDELEGPIRTNSHGLFDQEYSVAKPAGVRRVAVLGDSISRGWCVPTEERFDTLIEKNLRTESGEPFEFINFGVSGYRMTQIYDVAMEKVPAYQPDVYLLMLSQLSITPTWGAHVVQLVENNRDLKYDFLKKVVKDSGLQKGDSPGLAEAKLAPYRFTILREMLLQLKANAEAHSAKLVVALVPAGEDPDVIANHFRGINQSLDGTGIPVINLLDAFDGIDAGTTRRAWYDAHPNALGQRLIAESLQRKLKADTVAWRMFEGIPGNAEHNAKIATSPTTPFTGN